MYRKRINLRSEEYLRFVRSLPCPCGKGPPSSAHHWPPKGRRGDVDDTRTIPVCVECHQRCHGITVVRGGQRLAPITSAEQDAEVNATFRRFMTEAPEEDVRSVIEKMRPRSRAVAA